MSREPKFPLSLPNGRRAHGIVSAGHPDERALRDAASLGFRTIINLQLEAENGVATERSLADELGLTYVSIPIAGAAGITADAATALHRALEAATEPVIVHCAGGNRVGALMALRAFIHQGSSAEDAIAVGKATGLRGLEGVVAAKLAQL